LCSRPRRDRQSRAERLIFRLQPCRRAAPADAALTGSREKVIEHEQRIADDKLSCPRPESIAALSAQGN
jgi:hypothetical protein